MAPPKRMSIFAQRMEAERGKRTCQENISVDLSEPQSDSADSQFGSCSYIVNSLDADSIHNENIQKLNSLSIDEIKEEQSRLLKDLDPGLVHFIRRKREKLIAESMNISEGNSSVEDKEMSEAKLSALPELANKYVHMDVIEEEKLKWLEDLPPLPPVPPDVPYNARFDFKGALLPYQSDSDKTLDAGLHHHGEEPQRPGYTLQELLQLSRSSVSQQRMMAITTLAAILEKAEDYDSCFDTPLREQLMNPELFLLLRFSLDDSVRSLVMAALHAICSLLVCHLDELCFDRELGTFSNVLQPLLYIHDEDLKKEEKEIKDADILKLDVIKGALRTDLLPRLRYILKKMEPESIEIVHLLKILIRIVRHSYESTLEIMRCPHFLDSISNILKLPPGQHTIEALKFFRLIASHNNSLAYHLLEASSLIDPVLAFIAAEHVGNHRSAVMLICECFHLWQTFVQYGITIEKISYFSSVIHKSLIFHLNTTSVSSNELDISHACSIFMLLEAASAINYHCVEQFVPLAMECCQKWFSQLLLIDKIDWFFCKLCGVVLRFLAVYLKNQNSGKIIGEIVKKLISSERFNNSSQFLSRCSWLLRGDVKKSPENLLVLGTVPPTLQQHSVLPLFSSLAIFFLHNPYDWATAFLKNHGVVTYFKEIISDASIHKKCNFIYARHEIEFLLNCCKLCIALPLTDLKEVFHELALVLVICIQTNDKNSLPDLFKLLVFNPTFYDSYLGPLDSSHSETFNINDYAQLQKGLDNISNISSCYLSLLNLTSSNIDKGSIVSLFSSPKGLEPALPTDWQFLPIMHLHNSRKVPNEMETLEFSLQWICILEYFRPNVVARTSAAARFCRLSCVLLLENLLFHDFSSLIDLNLKKLLQYNDTISFDKPISGLTSFYDFYRELIEQLNSVSYNDVTFSNFIVVPLQQKHSDRYRKLIWSEQASTIRFLGTPVEKYYVPLKNYLEPLETDESLLTAYLFFLATGKVRPTWSPLLYRVAIHHVASYVKTYPDRTLAKVLHGRIKSLGNKELKSTLLCYQYDNML